MAARAYRRAGMTIRYDAGRRDRFRFECDTPGCENTLAGSESINPGYPDDPVPNPATGWVQGDDGVGHHCAEHAGPS
jgi:hypothetical protein